MHFSRLTNLAAKLFDKPWSRLTWLLILAVAVAGGICGLLAGVGHDLMEGAISETQLLFVASVWAVAQAVSKGTESKVEFQAAEDIFDVVGAAAASLALAYLTARYTVEQFIATTDTDPSSEANTDALMISVLVILLLAACLTVLSSSRSTIRTGDHSPEDGHPEA